MHYVIDGVSYTGVKARVREVCEAEQALGVNGAAGSGATLAVSIFAAIRRANPDMMAARIADLVMNAELDDEMIVTDEEEAEQSPPAEEPAETEEAGEEEDEAEPVPDLESQRTSGPLRSVAQA